MAGEPCVGDARNMDLDDGPKVAGLSRQLPSCGADGGICMAEVDGGGVDF